MKVLFVLWEGGGNVNPFLGLGAQLLADGHTVGCVATASLSGRLGDAGMPVVQAAGGWLPDGSDLAVGVAAAAPDVIVVDYMLTEVLSAAESTGLPTVALVHTMYTSLLQDGAPHPMGMCGPPASVNEFRASHNLAPIETLGDLLAACDKVLVTCPAELDQAAGSVPQHVVHVGPLFEDAGPDAGWQPPEGEGPLVVIGVGTAGDPKQEQPLLETIFAAVAELPVRGLATVPPYLDTAELAAPANVTLSGYLRHPAVLPHASLLISHAGLGSVCAALAYGVPMVCLPLDREQPENAQAVQRLGAGVALDPECSVEELRAAITAALQITYQPYPAAPTVAANHIESLAR